MKTLDRYIIRQFFLNFIILTIVLMSLFVLVDMILDLDEFTQAAHKHADRFGGFIPALFYILFDYYTPLVLMVLVYFLGILTVGAMGFTFTALTRTGELVAMAFGGLSIYRIAAPVLIVGGLINFLSLPNQELLIPNMISRLTRNKQQLKTSIEARPSAVHYACDEKGNLLSAVRFDPINNTLSTVTILMRQAGIATARIESPSATWDAQHGRWQFPTLGVSIRQFGSDPSKNLTDQFSSEYFETSLTPDILLVRRASIYMRLMSLESLYDFLGNSAVDHASVLQIMHARFSLIVVNILILVMGLPFFLLREERNELTQGIKAAALCLGAWGSAVVMLQISSDAINPVTAAWLPVMIYLPVSAAMLLTVRT